MMRRSTILQFPSAPDAPRGEPLFNYRGTVVELPWPDFLGRRILLAIDWNGRIFDQMAVDPSETQRVTDRMTADLGRLRERQQGPKLLNGAVSLPVYELSDLPGAS